MATQHNTFIRKFGNKAIIITVTDWEDFKELEAFSKESDPDFLVGAVTTKSIYSNMLPNVVINTSEARDITEGTQGTGLASILTKGCNSGGKNGELSDLIGGIWAHRKCGLTYAEEMSKPTITEKPPPALTEGIK